jgi:hypothetical protein
VLQTNGTTTAVTIGTNQVVTLAQPLPAASGGTGSTATPTAGGVPYGTGSATAFTAAGTSGQVLTSAGSSAPTWATAASGLTLLATATASASATVSLETGIGATYDDYFVTFLDVTASSDDVELRVKLKFSGTYADSLTSQGYYKSSDSAGSISGLGQATCTVNRYRVSIYTATGKNVGGELWFNRTANAKYQMLRFQSSSWSPNAYGTDVVADSRGSGFWNNTNAVQGIQFYMSTGNIQSGTFRLYGIQNS